MMAENIPKLMTDNQTWTQEAQRTPSSIKAKQNKKQNIIFRLQNKPTNKQTIQTMDEILKEAKRGRRMS